MREISHLIDQNTWTKAFENLFEERDKKVINRDSCRYRNKKKRPSKKKKKKSISKGTKAKEKCNELSLFELVEYEIETRARITSMKQK